MILDVGQEDLTTIHLGGEARRNAGRIAKVVFDHVAHTAGGIEEGLRQCLRKAGEEAAALGQRDRMRKHHAEILKANARGSNEVVFDAKPVFCVDAERVVQEQIVVLRYRTVQTVLDGQDRGIRSPVEHSGNHVGGEAARNDGRGTTKQVAGGEMTVRPLLALDGHRADDHQSRDLRFPALLHTGTCNKGASKDNLTWKSSNLP